MATNAKQLTSTQARRTRGRHRALKAWCDRRSSHMKIFFSHQTPSRINLDRAPFSAVLSGHCRHHRPPACYWQPGLAALAPPACSRLLDRGAYRGRHYPAHPSAAPSPAEIRAPSRLPYPCSGSGASRSRIVAPTCPAPRTRAAGGEASQLVRAALGQTKGKRGAAGRPTHGGSLLRLSGIL